MLGMSQVGVPLTYFTDRHNVWKLKFPRPLGSNLAQERGENLCHSPELNWALECLGTLVPQYYVCL